MTNQDLKRLDTLAAKIADGDKVSIDEDWLRQVGTALGIEPGRDLRQSVLEMRHEVAVAAKRTTAALARAEKLVKAGFKAEAKEIIDELIRYEPVPFFREQARAARKLLGLESDD